MKQILVQGHTPRILDQAREPGRFRVPDLNPFFNGASGGLTVANRRFEAIRANHSRVMKLGVFLRIDSRESPRFELRMAGPSKFLTVGQDAAQIAIILIGCTPPRGSCNNTLLGRVPRRFIEGSSS